MHIRVRDHGANVNAEDNRGRTPLYQVLEDENLFNEYRFGIAQLLIERSLAVDKQEKYHETALHLTARTMSFELHQEKCRALTSDRRYLDYQYSQ